MSERVLSPSGINFYLQAQQQNNKTGSNSDLTAEQIAGTLFVMVTNVDVTF